MNGGASGRRHSPCVTAATLVAGLAVLLDGCGTIISEREYDDYLARMAVEQIATSQTCLPIASYFGLQQVAIDRQQRRRLHDGLDIPEPDPKTVGRPIISAAPGVVSGIVTGDGGGLIVALYHGMSDSEKYIFSEYMHLSAEHVRLNQQISRGETIAAMGNSGQGMPRGRPVHLHFGAFEGDSSRLFSVQADQINVSGKRKVNPADLALRLPNTNTFAPFGSMHIAEESGKFKGFTYPLACGADVRVEKVL